MTDNTTIIQGVDLETFEGFAEYAADNPTAVQFGLGATSTYEGTVAHSLAHIDGYELGGEAITRPTREYTIPFGGWREVLETAGWVGATDRPEPIEVALAALASCINVGITINAVANGVEIDHLKTTVRTAFDPGLLFSLTDFEDADGVFDHLEADVEIAANGLEPDQVDEWARRAPVYTLLSREQDIDLTIDTKQQVLAE